MKTALVGCLGLFLTSCTAAYVESEAIASNQAVEAATNSVLVMNILRARDGAPTFFSDVSHLRGALQTQASISAPTAVGPYDVSHWTGRSLVSPSFSLQSSPSFDVAPLNSESFTRGINEPIDVRVFQYYLDRAIPPDLLLQLFVDKIEDVRYEGGRAVITPYYNVPCDTPESNCGLLSEGAGERRFDRKIRGWVKPYLFLHAYKLLLPHGPAITVNEDGTPPAFRDLVGSASQNLVLRPVHTGPGQLGYQYFTVSNNIAFCVPANGRSIDRNKRIPITVLGANRTTSPYEVIRVARNTVTNAPATISEAVEPSACVKNEVIGSFGATGLAESYTALHFRSVDGMIEFLGRMLRVPLAQRALSFDISQSNTETARLSVKYQGATYYVHDRRHSLSETSDCHDVNQGRCQDRTLEIIALVNQLLNLHKNRSDLPSTGAVQVVN